MTNLPATKKQPVIAQYLDRYKDQIAAALPRHMTPDRMARIVLTEVRKVPALLKCDPKSLFGGVVQASQLGLEPGSALGHCYLLPYGKNVQLIIGYKGMIDLARRSGQIRSIEARSVHEGDDFEYSFGLNPDLKHTPAKGHRGALLYVYAVAHLSNSRGEDGGVQWDVMSVEEVEEIRKQSKAANNGPWVTHFTEMAKKTVIRRLFKFLPVSIEMQTATGLDEQADAGIPQQNEAVITGEFTTVDDLAEEVSEQAETRTDSLKEKLAAEGAVVDMKTGEVIQEEDVDAAPTLEEVKLQIDSAKTSEQLDEACEMIALLANKDRRPAVAAAAKARAKIEG